MVSQKSSHTLLVRLPMLVFFLCLAMLTACTTKPVHVIQAQQFKLMAARMPQELIARKLISSNQNYTVATAPFTQIKYGQALYDGLNPSFLIGDVVSSAPSTFAQSLSPQEKVSIHATGFSIEAKAPALDDKGKPAYGAAGRRIDVDMVAISDWDGNGQDDWIVTCRYIKNYGAYPRIYYMVIPRTPLAPASSMTSIAKKLPATVIAIYEEAGPKGRMYLRESKAHDSKKNFGQAQDVVPGLKNITEPPSATKKAPANTVQERNL